MNKYKRLGQNIVLMTLGNIGSKLITFFLVPLYTSALTTEQYGTTDLVFTLYSLLIPIVTFECYFALMRFSLEEEADHRQLFSAAIYINIIGIIILTLIWPIFVAFDTIAPYYWYFIAYCFTTSINNVLLYFARGIDRVRDYAISTIINTAFVVIFNVIFLLVLKLGTIGYLMAYTFAPAISAMYLSVKMKVWHYMMPISRVDSQLVRRMAIFCIPLIPNSVSWWVSNQSDKFVIIFFEGVALSGIYAISQKIPSVLNIVSNIFINAWQISSVEDFGSDESKSFYSDIYNKYLTVQLAITSLVLLFCRLGAIILFKKGFYTAWHYVPILAIGAMFHAMGSFFSSVYTAGKKTGGIGVSTIIAAIANIALNFLLIPAFHAYGAAVATLISYVLIVVVRLIHSRSFFRFEIKMTQNLMCYAILTIQALITYIESPIRIVASLLCFISILAIKRSVIVDGLHTSIKILRHIITRGEADGR